MTGKATAKPPDGVRSTCHSPNAAASASVKPSNVGTRKATTPRWLAMVQSPPKSALYRHYSRVLSARYSPPGRGRLRTVRE